MPSLEDLVKLASLGTSGICIFGIFWTGWLLKGSADSNNNLYHQSLHKYMSMVISVAIIAGISGFSNAYIKQSKINNLEQENVNLEKTKNELTMEKQVLLTKTEEARKSLNLILKSKEAYQLRNPSPELETQLNQLENYLNTMDK